MSPCTTLSVFTASTVSLSKEVSLSVKRTKLFVNGTGSYLMAKVMELDCGLNSPIETIEVDPEAKQSIEN